MMPVIVKRCTFLILFSSFFSGLLAQYTVNGHASQNSCNEYTLTPNEGGRSGSVWNNIKIDLTQSFDFKFDVFLGNNNSPGADGIAFVLQPISTSVGSSGGGLGYENITPAIGVTIDTYSNAGNADPVYDHIAIQLNGNLSHNNANNIAGPVQALNGIDNIEDGQWHALRVTWDAATKTLTAYMDGVLRVSAAKDIVTDVLGGNPLVFWGFTGSTGGEFNLQKFKTALNPAFHFPVGQKRCVNEPIQFIDSTISFTNIVKFYWNFGDGSPFDSVNLNPVHTYITGGDYTVTQRVIGADGCEAVNIQTVRIGTKPGINLNVSPFYCADAVPLSAIANVVYGTIDPATWFWDLDNGITATIPNPVVSYPLAGIKNIYGVVKTIEGCVSDTHRLNIQVYTKAYADFMFTDSVCLGKSTNFFGTVSSFGGASINGLGWNIDGQPLYYNQINPSHTFLTPGLHTVQFGSTAADAPNAFQYCPGIKIKTVFVKDKPTAKPEINTSPICEGMPVLFVDSSTANSLTQWSWTYNGAQWSTLQNSSKTFTAGSQTVGLVATSANGCSSDTAFKTFFVNPLPNVTMSFKDACKFAPVNFTAVDNSGTVTQWKWNFGDGSIANTQNATHTYNANGTYKVKLYAITPNGCYADTLQKDITIYGTNASAGNDTIAAAGQPVMLHASGGLSYLWSPATLLNDASSATPTTVLQSTQTFTLKAFTPEGCESYDDVTVKIYKGPDIYLPNAFTPNGDGLNDIFRGVPVGIQQFDYLKIFNRWGQLVFYTADYRKGWNGLWQSQQQPGGVYVVMVKGKDYKGNIIEKKATVMLIR